MHRLPEWDRRGISVLRPIAEIVNDAVVTAAQTPIYDGPKSTPEANLVWGIGKALMADPHVRWLQTEYGCPLEGWTRNPGGIDLAAWTAPASGDRSGL